MAVSGVLCTEGEMKARGGKCAGNPTVSVRRGERRSRNTCWAAGYGPKPVERARFAGFFSRLLSQKAGKTLNVPRTKTSRVRRISRVGPSTHPQPQRKNTHPEVLSKAEKRLVRGGGTAHNGTLGYAVPVLRMMVTTAALARAFGMMVRRISQQPEKERIRRGKRIMGGGFGFGLLVDVQMLGFFEAQHHRTHKHFLAYVLQVSTTSSQFLIYRCVSFLSGRRELKLRVFACAC